MRWVEQNGKWYQATWVDYDLERERVTALVPHNDAGGYRTLHWGQNKWEPIDIKDIYQSQARNPRLRCTSRIRLGVNTTYPCQLETARS